jgi:hypothetical protein
MKRTIITGIITALLAGSIAGPGTGQAAAGVSFTDVQGHWAETSIKHLAEQGILDGYPDGTFRPDEPIQIDQYIKMLLLSYSNQHQNGERSWKKDFLQALSPENRDILAQDYRNFTFKASPVGYWAKPYIDLASDLSFISKARFPDVKAPLKRENAAEIIYYTLRQLEYVEDEGFSMAYASGFGDLLSASSREQRFIAEAYVKGIMDGYPNGYFGVGRTVTRAEALTMLDRITAKEKRVPLQRNSPSMPELSRVVPAKDGSYKPVLFPSRHMLDAYDVMQEAAKLRGTNYDLVETFARLYKDKEDKGKAIALGGTAGVLSGYEEAALWLEPAYKTYGVTLKVGNDTWARNEEPIRMFTNHIFGYNAELFRQALLEAYRTVEQNGKLDTSTVEIGGYSVETRLDGAGKALTFSIVEKTH